MDPAIFVAITAGVAVVLLFFGLFGGRRVSPTQRSEQVAGAAADARNRGGEPATVADKRGLRASIFGSRGASGIDRVVARRDWGANLSKELARADLAIRPSEYLAIRAGAIV